MQNKTLQKNMKDSGIAWIKEIPRDWSVVPMRELFSTRKEKVGRNSDQYTLLRLSKGGVFPKGENAGGKNPENYDTYQEFEKGDLVFCLFDYDVTPRTIGIVNENGMLTGAYTRLIPKKDVAGKYYYYYYLVLDNEKTLLHLCTGLRNTISKYIFWTLSVMKPSKIEQEKIVSFLDTKTSNVDSLIEKKKQMIELLQEKRSSIITYAVTKGLDPSVKMKDSGVDWIGGVPENWKLDKIKFYIKYHFSGMWGAEPLGDKNDLICLRVADFDYANLGLNLKNKTLRNFNKDVSHKILNKGDLLIEKSGGGEKTTVGRVIGYNLDEVCMYSNFVEKIILRQGVDDSFLLFIFHTMHNLRVNTKHIKQTTGIQNLDINSYFNNIIPIPPLEVQEIIVDSLNEETQKIDSTISKVKKQIELLKEYKSSMIYHAVTGKLEI